MNIHAIYGVFLRRFRKRRMEDLAKTFPMPRGTKVLDIGGTAYNWSFLPVAADVTILNLSVPDPLPESPRTFSFEAGDARDLHYEDSTFDVAVSNSVIEHMGTYDDQVRFAQEIRRVANGVWVQVPAREFVIEPHYLTPFVHWLPRSWRRRILRNFSVWGWITRPTQDYVDGMVEEIRLPTRREMQELFPDCEIRTERFLGLSKAHVAVRTTGNG